MAIDWRPVLPDYSQGLRALAEGVDSYNANRWKRREMERQALRDLAADEYNRAQVEHLRKMDERSADADRRAVEKDEEEAALKIAEFMGKGPAGLPMARALANRRGGTIEEGTSAPMPKLQLEAPTMEPEPEAQQPWGLSKLLRGPQTMESQGEPEAAPEKAPPVDGAPGLVGLFKGQRLDPGDIETEAKLSDHRQAVGDWSEAETANPFREGMYRYRDKSGKEITVDPGAGRAFERAQAEREGAEQAEQLERAAETQTNPQTRQALLNEAARLRAVLPGASAQHLRNREGQEDSQEFQAEENAQYRLTAEQQREIERNRARRARSGSAAGGIKGEKAKVDLENAKLTTAGKYDGIVQKVLQNYGFKELNSQAVRFNDLAGQIAGASDNAALAAVARGSFVKMAQGGTGIISDSDMRTFWGRIGGLGMQAREAWDGYVKGTLPKEKRAVVEAAVRDMEAAARSNMNDVGGAIVSRLSTVPGGKEQLPTYLKAYAPDYYQQFQAEQANAGNRDAQGAVKDEIARRYRKLQERRAKRTKEDM